MTWTWTNLELSLWRALWFAAATFTVWKVADWHHLTVSVPAAFMVVVIHEVLGAPQHRFIVWDTVSEFRIAKIAQLSVLGAAIGLGWVLSW